MRSVPIEAQLTRRRAGLLITAIATLLVIGAAPTLAQSETAGGDWLFIDADTVQGPANLTEAERAANACVQDNRFARNEEIVWRVKVFDPLTGEPMDDSALTSLQAILPDQVLDLHYGPHPRDTPADFFWTVSWDIPETYPSGELPYTLVATAVDGRSGTYEQFNVSPARLIVTEEVRPVIEDEG